LLFHVIGFGCFGLSLQKPCKSRSFPASFQNVFADRKIILHLRPVNQTLNLKMKKIITFVAVSAMVSLVACGGDDAEKRKADSIREADSLAKIAAAEQAKADSLRAVFVADSTRQAWVADSTRKADSAAEAEKNKPKGGGKPKTPKNPETPKVGGTRPGAK
jgi:hypothetical protein